MTQATDPRAALLSARRDALSQAAALVRLAEQQRAQAEALQRAVQRLDAAEARMDGQESGALDNSENPC